MEKPQIYKKLTEEMVLKAVKEAQKKYKRETFFVFFPLNWEIQRAIDEEVLKQIRNKVYGNSSGF